MKTFQIINGPNLNLLGQREVTYYGNDTWPTIFQRLVSLHTDVQLLDFQSNWEGGIIDCIQATKEANIAAIVINAGGYSHTSVAIADALRAVNLPTIEVHLSHLAKRDAFRHHSIVAEACNGSIMGLGWQGYNLAISYLKSMTDIG